MKLNNNDQYTQLNDSLSDLNDVLINLSSILNGHILGYNTTFIGGFDFEVTIMLNMQKNVMENYLTIDDRDMRFYVPKINSAFNVDCIAEMQYLSKPKPLNYTSEYLGEKIRWRLGYTTNIFKLKVTLNDSAETN